MVPTVLLICRTCLLILGLVMLLGTLAEAVLRRKKPELDYFYVLVPWECKTHYLEPGLMPGLSLISHFRTNSLGIRGREFAHEDEYRVLAIGCSVTISAYVDQEKSWTSELERKLSECTGRRVWAGCVGRSTVTTRDLITYMRYFVPQYRASLDALVFLVGVNDLALMLSKGLDFDPEYLNKGSLEYRCQRAFSRLPNRYSRVSTWRKLALTKLALSIRSRARKHIYTREGLYYVEQRARRQHAERLLTDLPDLTLGLDEFDRNLNTIADLAQQYGLCPVFMTQPSLWRSDLRVEEQQLLWFGWVAGTACFYSVTALEQGIAMYNERTLRVSHARGLKCVDLAAIVPKDTSAFYDDVHLNEGGSRLVAEHLAARLAEGLCEKA